VDKTVCREHLEKLLAEEASALTRLEALLDREHELLLANDVEEFDRTGVERQSCVGALVRIEDERRSLCRAMNLPLDASGVDRLLNWCDPSHNLKRRWAACAERAIACRERNDRNGALVAARLKKVEGLLDVLTGKTNQPKVYARQGGYEPSTRSARVLATV
jgi:flagellar biosynthesis/type III secretory pathway chaperone